MMAKNKQVSRDDLYFMKIESTCEMKISKNRLFFPLIHDSVTADSFFMKMK